MLTIRKAHPEDASLLREIGYASYIHHFAHLWYQRGELEDFLQHEYSLPTLQESLQNHASCWFIAEDISPIGFAKVTWHAAMDEHGPAGTLLHKLYLLPDETGKGYGEQIMTQLMRQAWQRGESFFWLEVLSSNTAAQRFYQRLGLMHLKDVRFSTPSQQSTLHIFGKNLQEGG